MEFAEYQTRAMALRLPSANELYAVFNLVGEVGEFCGKLAKAIRDGIPEEEDHMRALHKELGDILWQLTAIAKDTGTTLEGLAVLNLEKLESRKERTQIQGSGDNR